MGHNFGINNMSGFIDAVDNILYTQTTGVISGLERMLSVSGKRYRPGLVIAIAFYSGKKIDEKVINAAAAIELIHLASLIHDDIMDNGKVRHGVPTINSKEGMNSALLAGDYLLAKGCVLAAGISAEAAKIIAGTITSLCEGQARELNDQFNPKRTIESLNLAVQGKTSSIFISACVLGGLVSDLGSNQLKLLTAFGENLGIYYQYMDDIQDLIVRPEATNKSMGSDIYTGNYTLPIIMSLQGAHKEELTELLNEKSASLPKILEILKSDNSIKQSKLSAESYKKRAQDYLKKLENRNLAGALNSFVNSL